MLSLSFTYIYMIYLNRHIDTLIHTCMHTCIHAYMHSCIHTYIYIYITLFTYTYIMFTQQYVHYLVDTLSKALDAHVFQNL